MEKISARCVPGSALFHLYIILIFAKGIGITINPDSHAHPPRPRPRPQHPRQALPRRHPPRIRLHLRAMTVKKSKIFCCLQSFPEKYSISKVKSLPVDLFNFAIFICKICCKNLGIICLTH